MSISNVIPFRGFDYLSPANPTATSNPKTPFALWLNTSTGNIFICTDNTTDANVWKLRSGFRGALVSKTSDQTFTTATSTPVQYNTTTYDTDSFFGSSTTFTIPYGVSKIRLSASIVWDSNSTGERVLRFNKNSSVEFAGNATSRIAGMSSGVTGHSVTSGIVSVSSGDTFQCEVYQTSGGNLNDDYRFSWFSIEVIE